MPTLLGLVVALLLSGVPVHTYAADPTSSLSLSVTPPLYQMNVSPGDFWKSTLKVINNNPYQITVYTEVNTMSASGEQGYGNFTPRDGGFDPSAPDLPNWIDVSSEPIVVPPEQSVEVPVSIVVPKDASPGGHFAAIFVGTKPPEGATGESSVRTSQIVTSLFFMRVAGDITEAGSIREFSLKHSFYETPQADFSLRFENKGNVYLQPQGDITIYNMWGKVRGSIPINQKSRFGNVLPNSIRLFDFSWKGEESLSDIGRYTAEVTLSFGQDVHQNTSSRVYFWVIPLRGVAIVLFAFATFAAFVVFVVRRYIRRTLVLSGYEPGQSLIRDERTRPKKKDYALPLREGVLDLRRNVIAHPPHVSFWHSLTTFISTYRLFFLCFAGFVVFVIVGGIYFFDVLQRDKSYHVTVQRGGSPVTLTSEEVKKEEKEGAAPAVVQTFPLFLINESKAGMAQMTVRHDLTRLGYTIADVSPGERTDREHSAIVYDAPYQKEALTLSAQLGTVPVSANTRDASSTGMLGIRIFVGKDMVQ